MYPPCQIEATLGPPSDYRRLLSCHESQLSEREPEFRANFCSLPKPDVISMSLGRQLRPIMQSFP